MRQRCLNCLTGQFVSSLMVGCKDKVHAQRGIEGNEQPRKFRQFNRKITRILANKVPHQEGTKHNKIYGSNGSWEQHGSQPWVSQVTSLVVWLFYETLSIPQILQERKAGPGKIDLGRATIFLE